MKKPTCVLAFAALLALSPSSFAGSSAKQAIETLKTAEGSEVTSNIIGLTGHFGQDQPQEWEILARRGDEFAMFIVDSKSILSVSKVRAKQSKPISTEAVRVDSPKAFRIAEKSAKTASISFDSLSYELRPRSDSPAPVWIVRLVDVLGITVGEVHIAADSGTMLRTNWNQEQLNRPPAPELGNPSTGATRGILADRRGGSVQTGSTADGIRDGLAGVGSSIRNVFRRGGEVSKTDERRGPKTTKTKPN
jgi:hypothetical protein